MYFDRGMIEEVRRNRVPSTKNRTGAYHSGLHDVNSPSNVSGRYRVGLTAAHFIALTCLAGNVVNVRSACFADEISQPRAKTQSELDAAFAAAFPLKQSKFTRYPREVGAFNDRITELLRTEDFDGLEKLAQECLQDESPFPNGDNKLEAYHILIGSALTEIDSLAAIDGRLKIFERWAAAKPESMFAKTSLMQIRLVYAWEARGRGFAATVSDEGWRLFRERMESVDAWIKETEKAKKEIPDPYYYSVAIEVAKATGKYVDRMDEWIRKSARAKPLIRAPFIAAAEYYLPRWHGGPGELEEYARKVYELTSERCGAEMYGRVATQVRYYHGRKIFEDFDLDWNLVQQGYCDIAKRAPNSLFCSSEFCLLAWYAGKRDVARRLIEHTEGRYEPYVWKNGDLADQFALWALRPTQEIGKTVFELDQRGEAAIWDRTEDALWFVGERGLHRLDLKAAKTIDVVPVRDAISLAGSADGRYLAVGTKHGVLLLIDFGARKIERLPTAEVPSWVQELRFSSDGKTLLSRHNGVALQFWDVESREATRELRALTGGDEIKDFTPDLKRMVAGGNRLNVSSLEDEKIVGTPTLAPKRHVDLGVRFRDVAAVSPDGRRAVTCDDATLRLWNVDESTLLKEADFNKAAAQWAIFTPDGTRVITAMARHQIIEEKGFGPTRAGFRKSVIPLPSEIVIWNSADLTMVRKFEGHQRPVRHVSLSPDGKRIASVGEDWTIRIWTLP